MPDDKKRERQKAPSEPQAERPVAEREALTITVIEPAVSQETGVRVPRDTAVRAPGRVARIPVPRWYWLLVGLAVTLVVIDYRVVWAARIQFLLEHRIVPTRVVRIEHSLWRHISGEPKEHKPLASTP